MTKNRHTSIRIPEDLHRSLRILAALQNISLGRVIQNSLEQLVEKHKADVKNAMQ